MINPIPMGSGCDNSKPKSERDFARLVSRSASCCDLGLKSNPPPMKPVNHVNQISPQIVPTQKGFCVISVNSIRYLGLARDMCHTEAAGLIDCSRHAEISKSQHRCIGDEGTTGMGEPLL